MTQGEQSKEDGSHAAEPEVVTGTEPGQPGSYIVAVTAAALAAGALFVATSALIMCACTGTKKPD